MCADRSGQEHPLNDEDQMLLLKEKIAEEYVQLAKGVTELVTDANAKIDRFADEMIALRQKERERELK